MRDFVEKRVAKVYTYTGLRILLLALGVCFFLPVFIYYLIHRNNNEFLQKLEQEKQRVDRQALQDEVYAQVKNKREFFHRDLSNIEAEVDKEVNKRVTEQAMANMRQSDPALKQSSFLQTVTAALDRPWGLAAFIVAGFPAFLFILIVGNAFARYTFQRVMLMAFVIIGVTFLVFTILYISPMDAAYNILGQLARPEQIEQFNESYGLNQSYWVQMWEALKGIVTLNPGKSFLGGEDVISMIVKRLPITMEMTFASLLLAVAMAVPAGILSALRPYSVADYVVMIITLIGLSMPAFWMGLLLILYCSIQLGVLPVSYNPGNWMSLIMPVIVLGTGMAANVARTTRSSLLEVLSQDYIVTAKAKGLGYWKVILRHALGNAMIPIVTVVGLQFGSMMSGATVVEKVFNINGLGFMLVERQFIPDIPVVLAGVVYISLAVSLVNLFVDLLYAFLDPRIKAKIKGY